MAEPSVSDDKRETNVLPTVEEQMGFMLRQAELLDEQGHDVAACVMRDGVAFLREMEQQTTFKVVLDIVRYCAGCGSVGEVEEKYRDCCPDGGSMSVRIPRKVAEQSSATFKAATKNIQSPVSAVEPSERALRDLMDDVRRLGASFNNAEILIPWRASHPDFHVAPSSVEPSPDAVRIAKQIDDRLRQELKLGGMAVSVGASEWPCIRDAILNQRSAKKETS